MKRAVQLHAEPGGVHSNQRLDGGPVRTRQVFAWAIGTFTLGSMLCGISNNIHLLVACASCRASAGDDGAGGTAHAGADLSQIGTHPRDELRAIPG